MIQIEREKLERVLEALNHLQPTALTSFYTIGDRDKAITAIKEALAQPVQELVQFKCTVVDEYHPNGIPLGQWATPPKRPWVGLTDEERNKIRFDCLDYDGRASAIEAKLKEKNT